MTKGTDTILRFLALACQLGIKLDENNQEVFNPNGFDDLISLKIRPNPDCNFIKEICNKKAASWKEYWPLLDVEFS